MMRRSRHCLLMICLAANTAMAQSDPAETLMLDVDGVVRLALERNRDLQSARDGLA